jgi:tetratricopeptide (TPR) repeat protein
MLILAAALAVSQPPSGPAPPDPASASSRILQETGYASGAGDENGGWIRFEESRMRFRLPANPGDLDTLIRVIGAASERSVSIRVRYDRTSGRPDAEGDYVEYALCSISVGNGASYGDEAANCPERPAPTLGPGEADLVRGMAEVSIAPEAGRRSLAAGLAARGLNPRLRAMALETRGEAAEALAQALPWSGEAFDRIIFEGLADYRAWAAAAPDDPKPLHATARLLADLGGYDDALTVYRAIGRRWPEEAFNIAIRTGALYRSQGRYAEALAALDDYVASSGVMKGMRYSYHRAWTLQLLNRPAEALAEINRGFESQPDYPYAYFIRSCANAKLGRLADSLADQERGLELLIGFAYTGPENDEQVRTAREHIAALRSLVAAGARQPNDVPCQGFWRREIRSRARSPLLGAAPR